MKVVTHHHAYVRGRTIDICPACAADPDRRDIAGALGGVSHGLHRGTCDVCPLPTPPVWVVKDEDGEARIADAETALRVARSWAEASGWSVWVHAPDGTSQVEVGQ